ncbi:ribosome silencing factor [Spirochaetia bacterium 38H-sp]|uniref:Ribosomal silencing factor RsfS n=1 Tax=Rarispira pelagica TaxID=3141764 RepID=A0ABU9UE12_9SPIR
MADIVSNDSRLDVAKQVASVLDSHKAGNVVLLDVRECSSIADYFIICTSNSDAHLRGLVSHLKDFFEDVGIRVLRSSSAVEWFLLDCGDIIVNIMNSDTRDFYRLEELWHDAPVIFQSSGSN